MASKSKILFIGGTGYIGKFTVEASVKAGHPTFVLVRESTISGPSKSQLLDHFKNLGVNLVIGDVLNHESLVKAIKQVDVVISTVGHTLLADQVKIIAAIKEAGNVKRFLPSEFGNDVDRVEGAVEPTKSTYDVKAKIRGAVEAEGIPYTYGDVLNHESLVKAIKQVDVVISTVGHTLIADQVKIIAAIKEAGNVKRFFPSEFGNDVDRVHGAVEPTKSTYDVKAKIRRAVEAEGIPYTYVESYFFDGYFLPNLLQPGATAPPRDKVVIFGDGNPKVYNKEDDIGTYTIKAVDDPRTLNKNLYIQPPGNIYSFNDLVSLWERKIGKTLEREYVSEEQLLKNIQEAAPPHDVILSIYHSAFV
ncbi:hypothetical protein CUMW_276810, partial [Citrus unshiu]